MGKVAVNGREFDFDAVVNLMDRDIREVLHSVRDTGCTDQVFVDAYIDLHREIHGEEFIIN